MVDVIEGKTKRLVPVRHGPWSYRVFSKDDLTAGDGKKHDVLPGKGALANAITCNVFEMLEHHEVPLAFVGRDGDQFITRAASMIPYEVVVRNRATGSALKRNPDLRDGQEFAEPAVEFFYKTTGGKIGGVTLPCDDPFALFEDGVVKLYHPAQPVAGDPLHVLEPSCFEEVEVWRSTFERLAELALIVNRFLRNAWRQMGGDLWDFKIECGWVDGEIVVADVIDFDSWRVYYESRPVSKQLYRDGNTLEDVNAALQLTKRLTDSFFY